MQIISIYFKHKLILRKFSLEVFHYHACWVVDAYNITFSNCTATLRLQDIEVGKQKHLHVYQADQLNFRQGVGVWNLHPLGRLHIGGIYEMKNI